MYFSWFSSFSQSINLGIVDGLAKYTPIASAIPFIDKRSDILALNFLSLPLFIALPIKKFSEKASTSTKKLLTLTVSSPP